MNIKLIVTHKSPDLDAVSSVWILKRFDEQHFGDSQVAFVSAGDRISKDELVALGLQEFEVVHVDTGKGEFDHHMEHLANQKICAASLVRDHVIEVHPELKQDQALAEMVNHFVDVDHFGELFWPEPTHPRYLFQLEPILGGIKTIGGTDQDVVEFGLKALDAVYAELKQIVEAKRELAKGKEFASKWGRAIGIETSNDEVIKLAQKSGFDIAIRKDPEYGNIRIKAVPGKNIDLTEIYEKIVQRDTEATWYFHPSKTMLLNGSRKNQQQVPSRLSLEAVIAMMK